MIYADQMLNFLEDKYQGYYTVEEQKGMDFLKVRLNKENLALELTFDGNKQTIELNTFKGKNAVLTSLEALATNLDAYFFFELQFKPDSKRILEHAMNEFRPGETYSIKGIEGNATSSLKLITSTDVYVEYSKGVYTVKDAEGDIEAYLINENNYIVIAPTLGRYITNISNIYGESEHITISRLTDDTFSFKFESGLELEVVLHISDKYEYEVITVLGDFSGPVGLLEFDNIFNLEALEALYDKIKEATPAVENITEAYDMKEVDITVSDEAKELSSLDIDETTSEEVTTDLGDADIASDEPEEESDEEINVELDETVADIYPTKEVAMEEVKTQPSAEVDETVEVISLNNVLSRDGELLYVRFVCTDNMYDVPADKIDLDILEEETQIVHKGVLTTPAELAARKKAKKVTDETFISILVNNFYS